MQLASSYCQSKKSWAISSVVLAIGHVNDFLSQISSSRHVYDLSSHTNKQRFVQPPLPLIQQFKSLLSLHHLQSSTQPHTLYKAVLSVLHNKIQNTNPSALGHL